MGYFTNGLQLSYTSTCRITLLLSSTFSLSTSSSSLPRLFALTGCFATLAKSISRRSRGGMTFVRSLIIDSVVVTCPPPVVLPGRLLETSSVPSRSSLKAFFFFFDDLDTENCVTEKSSAIVVSGNSSSSSSSSQFCFFFFFFVVFSSLLFPLVDSIVLSSRTFFRLFSTFWSLCSRIIIAFISSRTAVAAFANAETRTARPLRFSIVVGCTRERF